MNAYDSPPKAAKFPPPPDPACRWGVVLLAAEDLESIEATLELLSDPDARARVASSERDIEDGRILDEAQIRAGRGTRRSR